MTSLDKSLPPSWVNNLLNQRRDLGRDDVPEGEEGLCEVGVGELLREVVDEEIGAVRPLHLLPVVRRRRQRHPRTAQGPQTRQLLKDRPGCQSVVSAVPWESGYAEIGPYCHLLAGTRLTWSTEAG